MGYGLVIRAQGKRACFTRPEMHAERVSYDVITPSAARGIMEAVYWKPAIRWVVDSIVVISPIEFASIRRNEVNSKLSYENAKALATGQANELALVASEDRAQRNALYLTDVDYAISFHFEMTDKAGPDDTPEKHYNMALRRLRKGQTFNHPYLGCREFPASVTLCEDGVPESFYAGTGCRDLGFMLYDLVFAEGETPRPQFFRAAMEDGVINVAAARRELVE